MASSLGILFGLLCMLGYGLADAICKVPSQRIGAVRTVFYRGILLSGLLLLISAVFFKPVAFTLKDALIMLFIAVLGYFPLKFYLKAVKMGQVGIISPAAKSSVITTVVLSLVFFGETLSLSQAGAIIGIVLGIVLISVDVNDLRASSVFSMSSGIPYALVSSVLWGITYFLLKMPVLVFGPILTSLFLEGGVTLSAGAHLALRKVPFAWPERKMLPYLLALALVTALGTLSFAFGISLAPVSIIAALGFASPLITIVYGRIAYKERLRMMQYLGALMIVGGVVGVSLS